MRSRSRVRRAATSPLAAPVSILLAAAAFLIAPRSHAQSIYLDANGDGVHTAADVLAPSGATVVDVWLRTDQNRDGSAASCSSEDGPLSMNGYEFVLHAANGTVGWGPVENGITQFPNALAPSTTPTECRAGAMGTEFLPPGTYRLARTSVVVATGTPSLDVAPSGETNGSWITSFVSQCSGLDFDNTLKLGSDWHDADGLSYGGEVRRPPRMAAIDVLNVPEGSVSDVPVTATDEDGDPLQFFLRGAPGFVALETTDPGSGVATGRLHVAPGYSDAMSYDFVVGVADGEFRDSIPATLVVPETNRPPLLGRWPHDYFVPVGESTPDFLTPSDPDGQSVRVFVVAGPKYMRVEQNYPDLAVVWFRPSVTDVGTTTGTLGASDGYTTVTETFSITVYSLPVITPLQDVNVAVGDVASQEIQAADPDGGTMSLRLGAGPAYVTVSVVESVAGSLRGSIRVAPGRYDVGDASATVVVSEEQGETSATFDVHVFDPDGDADAGRPLLASTFESYDVPRNSTAMAWGDFNEDGAPDAAVGAHLGDGLYGPMNPVAIELGRKDGTFVHGIVLTHEYGFRSLEVADFDADSHLDLLVATEGPIFLYRGRGDGSFDSPSGIDAGGFYQQLRVGDFDGDGWPDVVVTTGRYGDRRIAILLNDRTGGFVSGPDLTDGGYYPSTVAAVDLDRDGHEDLLVGDYDDRTIRFWRGVGDGTFGSASPLPPVAQWGGFVVADADGDGDPDLCA
ncbi:MAG TPA: FG-GAP-like repeat-containing protein, partial [Candidatus Eisenbacteria bacterium]|nr:FG-GAP-like repeat-containing protein [Candidatus Eisenbacteria bacterium]